jgi:hypothetical protein
MLLKREYHTYFYRKSSFLTQRFQMAIPGSFPCHTPGGGTHRQHRELRRVAHAELGPDEPAPRDVRHLLFIKDGAQRDHAHLRLRPRVDTS